jgi:hypothetical protein
LLKNVLHLVVLYALRFVCCWGWAKNLTFALENGGGHAALQTFLTQNHDFYSQH